MKIWIRAIRPQFFTATFIAVVVGAVVAWHMTGQFNVYMFLLTLIGATFINAGLNLCNDYYDFKSKNDIINKHPTPFSGGSRVLPDGLISPKKILFASLLCFTLGSLIGLYLNSILRGNTILFIGIAGVFIAFFYTAEPIRIGYLGFGEVAVGFGYGPLVVVGSFYTQVQRIALEPILISIPIGILIGLVLYINEFQDYDADKAVNKRTAIVILGKVKAIKVYRIFILITYMIIILGVILRWFPVPVLITLLSLPLAFRAVKISRIHYDKIYELLPANAATIGLHLLVGLLLSGGYILDKVLIIG